MSKDLVIDVWDAVRKEWRPFVVMPYDPNFAPACKNNMHQFWPTAETCACHAITRTVPKTTA